MKKFFISITIFIITIFISISCTHALTEIGDLTTLTDKLSQGGELLLTSDITASEDLNVTSDVTLNLNGHKLNMGNKVLYVESNMTIYDGTESKSGSIEGTADFIITVGTSDTIGNLIIDSGTINCKGKYGIKIIPKSSLVMNDGTVIGKRYLIYNDGNFELNGGLIRAKTGLTIQNRAGSLFTMNGGTVTTDVDYQAVNLHGNCKAIINGGEIHAHKEGTDYQGNGITLYKNTELIVNGGLISTYGNAIMGNGSVSGSSDGSNAKITITGGTIISSNGAAVYNPQYNGETLITGGTLTGTSAIEVRAGKVTIEGGTFNGTFPYVVTNFTNGTSTDGAAVAIAQHDTKKPIDLTIKGGDFNAEVPISFTNPLNNEEEYVNQISINILGGNFRTTGDTNVISLDNRDILAGGTYDTDVSDLVIDGYGVKVENGIYSVLKLYNINIDDGSNEDLTTNTNKSFKGELIKVTPKEKWGFESKVILNDGVKDYEISNNEFVMPENDITLKVTYSVRYKILSGDNQNYNNSDITITTNGNIDKLENIKINDSILDKENIIIENGSTILTIKNDYLKLLSSGTYNVTFTYTDGDVSTKLLVNKETSNNPETLDNIISYFIILMLSLSIISFMIYKKKKVQF